MPTQFNNIAFAYDQARDMLDIRNIVVGHHPTLIGPTTSINGVFLGPFWYYLNIVPFVIGSGNPIFLVYWLIILFQLAGLILFISFKKNKPLLALLISSFFMMSPAIFNISRVSWSANPMPIFIVLYFLVLFSNLEKPTSFKMFLEGIIIGFALQIEAAFGILLLPFALLLFLIEKIHAKYFLLVLGFSITLIPQVLFEFKHNFLMTRVFVNEVTGKTNILGEKLTLIQSSISHLNSYLNSSHDIFEIPVHLNNFFLAAIIIFLIIRVFTKKINKLNKQYFLISLSFIFYSFASFLIFHHELKSWYLLGLTFPYLLIIAIFFDEILHSKNKTVVIITSFFITTLFISALIRQISYIPKGSVERSNDENNLKNEMEIVDWVYQKASGEGFKLFSYFPSVYDFPYQYLFWWYGTSKYGYQPNTISYLDNVPEYIPNNNFYLTQKKALPENYKTFLIIQQDKERPKRRLTWIDNFENLCLKEIKKFSWHTEVWIKVDCKKL